MPAQLGPMSRRYFMPAVSTFDNRDAVKRAHGQSFLIHFVYDITGTRHHRFWCLQQRLRQPGLDLPYQFFSLSFFFCFVVPVGEKNVDPTMGSVAILRIDFFDSIEWNYTTIQADLLSGLFR